MHYTAADFHKFPKDANGCTLCPEGDYSQVLEIFKKCIFSKDCTFSPQTNFYQQCQFGRYCKFGANCTFYKKCKFGDNCKFGDYCIFAQPCSFENGHVVKHGGIPFMKICGAGRYGRSCYFFNTVGGITVRAGCFFGTLEEFKAKVEADNDPVKSMQYLGFAEIVEKTWGYK